MNLKDYYTRDFANEGAKMFLQMPNGKISEKDYFIVYGTDSDFYRDAQNTAFRGAVDIGQIQDEEVKKEALRKSHLTMLASLVKETSDGPVDKEELIEFFKQSPNNADRIDRFASERSNFFIKQSDNS